MTDVTRLIIASFGIGIGAVVVPMVLNFLADAADRRKHRQKYPLPPLSEYEQMRAAEPVRPVAPREAPLRLPVIRRSG